MRGAAKSVALPIRPGMDVFDSFQNVYIGTVVGVAGGAKDSETSPIEQPPGSQTLGEEIGPVPTLALGNLGPPNQAAEADYATGVSHALREIEAVLVRPGRLNLGLLTPPIRIPASAIESLSMERIVLKASGKP